MAIKSSTGLRNYMLGAAASKGSFRDAFSGTSGELRIYGGTVPADADAAAGSTALVVIQKDHADPVNFADAASGVIAKASETWDGVIDTTGTATFYRLVLAADADGASTTEKRIQGTVGTTGTEDLVLSSATLTATQTQRIDYYQITFPATE
jgi:hypothetical protein